jgi:hypothetical protein
MRRGVYGSLPGGVITWMVRSFLGKTRERALKKKAQTAKAQ